MNKRTKIVCTMGPACDDDDILREMIRAGMNVARFNFSHGSHAEQRERMERVKRISRELGVPVGILLDTKGPEIRTGLLEGHAKVTLTAGSTVTVTAAPTSEDLLGTAEHFYLDHLELPREVHAGGTILIDDGLIGLTVRSIDGQDMVCRVDNGGELGERKGVNVPTPSCPCPPSPSRTARTSCSAWRRASISSPRRSSATPRACGRSGACARSTAAPTWTSSPRSSARLRSTTSTTS